ncbi:hypothetical protein FHS83_002977 [Rhizomicrobium palustre]|uniref:Uncharacterized protein n=1 Tax=Rhizomicrobium palustre TaxID=189966 RepID=A0A846N2C8_9PROT|nr:hypothetical protein [Rhizomicrobium palustre]NIK89659.1 hypothetical protein [Rhizomicrobium palustre]
MKLGHLVVAAVLTALAISRPVYAGGGSDNHMGQTMSQDQFNTLSDYADRAKRLTKEDKAKGKTLESLLAEDRAAVATLVKTLPLNCEVTDAIRSAEGPDTINGKKVDTITYEASCSNGMGYFLVTQEPEKPYGFSCFSVDATRQADIKAGRKPTAVCGLPASADMKKFAANILSKTGKTCTLKQYRYIGQNSANHTEFVEYACEDGKGYISVAGLPGANIPIHVETCAESASRGLPCKLSDNGAPAVSLKTFRDAMAEKKIACTADDSTTRLIGRENAQKRYVVEFQCHEQPGGLVAFIPLGDSTAPFETLDCAAAFKRGALCALPGNR